MIKEKREHLKKELWIRHFKESQTGTCLCCNKTMIQSTSFHAGHIVPEVYGGETTILNLLPICGKCNQKMNCTHLIDYAKNVLNIHVELDSEYSEYQKDARMRFECYTILRKKYIECKKEDELENISDVVLWLIDNQVLQPTLSVEKYLQFIKLQPWHYGYNLIDETSRVDEFMNIQIGEHSYDKIRLRTHCLGSSSPIIELRLTIEKSKCGLFPKVVWDGWAYLEYQGSKKSSGCYQFRNYPLWIQPYTCYLEK
jgi:hypothetical protein